MAEDNVKRQKLSFLELVSQNQKDQGDLNRLEWDLRKIVFQFKKTSKEIASLETQVEEKAKELQKIEEVYSKAVKGEQLMQEDLARIEKEIESRKRTAEGIDLTADEMQQLDSFLAQEEQALVQEEKPESSNIQVTKQESEDITKIMLRRCVTKPTSSQDQP
jgi:chromosome segregation ATPase